MRKINDRSGNHCSSTFMKLFVWGPQSVNVRDQVLKYEFSIES
jgi:hypothetical protein